MEVIRRQRNHIYKLVDYY